MISWLQQWRRNWRMAESRLLFLALLVSVTAVSSVTFFTDRTTQLMNRQASQVLGGDLVVRSSRPIRDEYLQQAEAMGLRTAQVISFPSMVVIGDKSQLVQLKAVSKNYPLFGDLLIADALSEAAPRAKLSLSLTDHASWAEPRVFSALNIDTGTTIPLGSSTFELKGVMIQSPDQGAAIFELMPQVLIRLEDLPQTRLLTPASRARFSQFYAGDAAQLKRFKRWLKPQLKAAEKIRSLEDGLPSIQQALQRGQRFLALASLLSVILAGVAIALTSYSLSRREADTVAVLKTLGASRRQILRRYLSQLFGVATLAGVIGIVLGFVIQFGLAYALRDFIGQALPAPGLQPVISGLLTAWLMVLGFSMPQLFGLVRVSPIQILQRVKVPVTGTVIVSVIGMLLGLLLLIWLQTGDFKLSLVLLPALIGVMLCFWLISFALLKLLRTLRLRASGKRLMQIPKANFRIALLIMVFGIGFFSLLLLTSLRIDLIDRWQATLPENAPNHFMINIQPDEVDSVRQFLTANQLGEQARFYPVVRGRLVEINDEKVTFNDFDNGRARGLLDREANLTMTAELPESNTMTAGKWFTSTDNKGLSVEQGIAEVLKLKLGDRLSFDIAGERFTDTITSFRTVRWDSMQPNFFIIAAPGTLVDKPHTYMTSLYVPKKGASLISQLLRQHPSISVIDVSSILGKIKELIDKAAFAVQTIFVFTLLAGMAVLFAAMQSQKAERMQDIAILKSLGARHRYLRNMLVVEFAMVGAIAGLIAAVFAMLASNILAYRLFDLSPQLNLSLLLVGILAGAVFVGAAGYLNMRPLLQVTPMRLLRNL